MTAFDDDHKCTAWLRTYVDRRPISWVFRVLKAETQAKYACKLLVYFIWVCAKRYQRIRKLNTVSFLHFFNHSKVLLDCLNDRP